MVSRVRIIILFMILPQIASAGLFDILNENYIESINELPYSAGIPSVEWQHQSHIKAWVDIVGFKNLTKENGVYLIQGDPASLAIVQYDAKAADVPGSVQKITKSLTTLNSNNFTVASLTVYLYWKSISCDKNSCWEVPHHETATFQDTEKSPDQFDKHPNPTVNIIEYNNTIEPKISITVIEPNASKIFIQYGNKSITERLKLYHVESTAKGVYYANISTIESWDVQGISRFGNSALINTNISDMNYSQLNITVMDIYGTVKADTFNIKQITYEPNKIVFNSLLFGFMGTLFTLFAASAYLIGRIQF